MNVSRDLRRLARFEWKDWMLLGEAAAALLLSSLAIALLPFRRLEPLLSLPALPPRAQPADIARLRWAVEAASRRLPWRIVCFQKGLALHWTMRRRGIDSRLHYGVAQKPEKGLSAHVWVSHAGEAVIGGEGAEDFACLATYPAP